MAKKAILLLLSAFLSTPTFAQTDSGEWEVYGDWLVKRVSDDMAPVQHATLRTRLDQPDNTGPYRVADDNSFIGFTVFDGSVVSLFTTTQILGRGFWPDCDFDFSSYRIGDAKPRYISTIDNLGGCNRVALNGQTIRDFKSGQSAQVKVGYTKGIISLKGFSKAWSRALQLSN